MQDLITESMESNMTMTTALSVTLPKYNAADVAWIVLCSILVWLMVPGIGFFYSGMARNKSALSLISLCFWSIAVVSVQWFFIGYTLSFSETGSPFIGDFSNVSLLGIEKDIDLGRGIIIPGIVFCLYQQMLAGITPALVIGATAERGRILPTVVFMFCWTTLVYDVLAYWTWAKHGWMKTLGVLDFAGGTPIHIAAGAAAIAYAKLLGERVGLKTLDYKPHNLVQVLNGTSLMWIGWFGFNGGSVYTANFRSAMVIVITNLSGSVGGITWAACDYIKDGKFSSLSFCFGALAGLVTITPASGYIAPWCAVVFGALGSLLCHWAIRLKDLIGVDDALDVAAVHGVCGLLGTVLTGIFAADEWMDMDGADGWLEARGLQVLKQFAGGLAGMLWSLGVTYLILWAMDKIPGLGLRLDEQSARTGTDKVEMGECAYERIPPATVI